MQISVNFPISDNYFMTEAYKTLRTNFLFAAVGKNCFCITSREMNEGKTSLALSVAYRLTELGRRVVCVDADMRRSYLAARYTESGAVKAGLSDYLSGQATLDEVLYSTQHTGMDIIFSGKYPPNPVELLSCLRMKELLAELREKYDYVLVDTPPVGQVIDPVVLAGQCDGTVIVIDAARNSLRDEKVMLAQLKKAGATVVGAVLTHVSEKPSVGMRLFDIFSRKKKKGSVGEVSDPAPTMPDVPSEK